MSTERSILNISPLELLAQSDRLFGIRTNYFLSSRLCQTANSFKKQDDPPSKESSKLNSPLKEMTLLSPNQTKALVLS